MARYKYAAISDLHCGSLRFDKPAFDSLVEMLDDLEIHADNLIVAGDVLEGKLNYRGQLYESLPLLMQENIAETAIERLVEALDVRSVHLLPGNHDRKYSINMLDNVAWRLERDLYARRGVDVHYYRDDEYFVVDDVLVLHSLSGFRGSDYTGATPQLLVNLVEFVNVVDELQRVHTVIVGHYHRPVDMVFMNKRIILLPSWQWWRPLRATRGIYLIAYDGAALPFFVRPTPPNKLTAYWRGVLKI